MNAIVTVTAPPPAQDMAVISDGSELGDTIMFTLSDVPPLPADMVYEGWLVSDDGSVKLSTGIMAVIDGRIDHTYISPTGMNLINIYNKAVITREPVPDPDPGPSGDPAYFHEIPPGGMAHIRHLLTGWPPGSGVGILENLREQVDVAVQHANLAADSTSLEGVLTHTHHVINIIEGMDGPNYDASFGDPGDGLGVLLHASDAKHAGFAAGAAPDEPILVDNAGIVEALGEETAQLATDARDGALQLLNVSNLETVPTFLDPLIASLEMALGKAWDAYWHGQLMATYTLMYQGPMEWPTCRGMPATLVGTDGDDLLVGTPSRDVILGLAGNDVIIGLDGDDYICAGPGDDLVWGGPGRDWIWGDDGDDILAGNRDGDRIWGNRGNDVILGGPGGDRLYGNRGHDVIVGGRGPDKLFGGGGKDTILGRLGKDTIKCGGGFDFADGGPHFDTAVGCEIEVNIP